MSDIEKPSQSNSDTLVSRTRRSVVNAGPVSLVAMILLLLSGFFATLYFPEKRLTPISYIWLGSIVMAILAFIFKLSTSYLGGVGDVDVKSPQGSPGVRTLDSTSTIKDMKKRIEALESRPATRHNGNDSSIKKLVLEEVRDFSESILVEDLVDRATSKVEEKITKTSIRDDVRSVFYETQIRLEREVQRLNLSGRFSLAFGAVISITGIMGLGYILISDPRTYLNTFDLVGHYAPRAGLVILLELLSFFFLGLYKSSLEDVKFYQNELTNIEQKLAAYSMVSVISDDTYIERMAKMLVETERNFRLKKGESTISIERERMSAENSGLAWIKALAPMIGKGSSKI